MKSPFLRTTSQYILLSLCWLVTSAPLITIGTACISLYNTVAHCMCFGEEEMFARYLKTFRRELTRGMGITAIWVVIGLLLNMGFQILRQNGEMGAVWHYIAIAYLCTMVLPVGILCWTIILESRFVYAFPQLCRNAIAFTLLHFPQTLGITAVFAGALVLVISCPVLVIFLPAAMVHLQTVFAEKVLVEYMLVDEVEDPDQDLEQD